MNTGLTGYCNKGILVPRVLCHSLIEVIEVPGKGMDLQELTEAPGMGTKVLQNSQKLRVLWHGRTELAEVPGRYKYAAPVPRVFVARAYRAYRSSGYGYWCRTELTEVPGMGLNILQNLEKFFVG